MTGITVRLREMRVPLNIVNESKGFARKEPFSINGAIYCKIFQDEFRKIVVDPYNRRKGQNIAE